MGLLKSFLFGILAAFGALFVELVLVNLYFIFFGQEISLVYFEKITVFLFMVVFIEEFFKYILLWNLYRLQNQKGMWSLFFFGLGFASLEIAFALFNMPTGQDLSHIIFSLAGVFLLHLTTIITIGYFLTSSKKSTALSMTKALIVTSSLHLLYNSMIILS